MSPSSVSYATVPAYAAPVRDARYLSVAALTFLVWQAILTSEDEVEYIWSMRNKSPFKWLYLYLRYGAIAAHVTHNCLMEQLTDGTNPPLLCDIWRVYIISFTQTLATSLECLLAVRVFALYNRSKKVAFLLVALILGELVGSGRMLWQRDSMEIHGTCLLTQLSSSSRDQTIIAFIVHCTLIGLTLFKFAAVFRAGWGRTPLVSLVIRDGSTVYVTKIFIVISVFLICDLEKDRGIAIAVFFWATALLSVAGCYLIVSMERLGRKEIPMISRELAVFTSRLEMDDAGIVD